ncbi:MAG: DUF4174 domain-containing protein [Eudoraea sp.]|nr:DUF4174 domain-containing protein [Eudoraea sp.]
MRQRLLLIIVFLLMNSMLQAQDLKDFRWKNRILLIMEPEGDLTKGKDQIELFSVYEQEMTERDLIIFVYDGKTMRDKTMKKLSSNVQNIPYKNFQGLILIGKDGGVKFKEGFTIDPMLIFEIIDSMPMRQSEIKNTP